MQIIAATSSLGGEDPFGPDSLPPSPTRGTIPERQCVIFSHITDNQIWEVFTECHLPIRHHLHVQPRSNTTTTPEGQFRIPIVFGQVDIYRRILFVARPPDALDLLDLSGDRLWIHPRHIPYKALVKVWLDTKLFSELY